MEVIPVEFIYFDGIWPKTGLGRNRSAKLAHELDNGRVVIATGDGCSGASTNNSISRLGGSM